MSKENKIHFERKRKICLIRCCHILYSKATVIESVAKKNRPYNSSEISEADSSLCGKLIYNRGDSRY